MSEYVVLKLCTGEQLLATVEHETLEGISVLDPIQVKMIPIFEAGEYGEQVISNAYCPFTRDRQFTFNYKDIIYCKDLNPAIVKYYKKLVLAFGEESKAREAFYNEKLEEREQEPLTVKSVKLH